MGEVQEQRFVCKICSKICSSGKSLGGHMRLHRAPILSSKSAAKSGAEINVDSEGPDDRESLKLEDGSKIQPKSAPPCEESLNNRDADLLQNPKKCSRNSDFNHGLSTASCCRECGKEFPTRRALSGHMRSHSIKNKNELHHCKTCGKGFESIRAMFGHMKTHSKRPSPVLATGSLSNLEGFCPVRKKRSMIRYKSMITDPSPSFSHFSESDSTHLELGRTQEVAEILIMLSRDVRDWSKLDSAMESFDNDDDFVCIRARSYGNSKAFSENGGHFVCDVDKKTSLLTGYKHKSVCGLADRGSVYGAQDEMKVDFQVSMERDTLTSPVQESDSDMKHQCLICSKVFSSGQALGGHKRAHYKAGFCTGNKNEETMECVNEESDVEVREELLDLNIPMVVNEGTHKDDAQLGLWWAREHEALGLAS